MAFHPCIDLPFCLFPSCLLAQLVGKLLVDLDAMREETVSAVRQQEEKEKKRRAAAGVCACLCVCVSLLQRERL